MDESQQHPPALAAPSLRGRGWGPAWSFQGHTPPQGRQAEAGTKVGEQSGWAGASLRLPPRSCGTSIVALTKAALFLPTTIPCQHPSAFRLQISCPLAAFQEAARAQNVDGKRISGAGWWKVAPWHGVQGGTGLCRGAALQKPDEQGSGVHRSGLAAPPRSPPPCVKPAETCPGSQTLVRSSGWLEATQGAKI